jgi:NAD(P)-dependent dehydrogenase (short-subunit alcohol dehydrogenase family)
MTDWTVTDIPDQSGRTVIVTGANSGLGFHTSVALARKGARVLLACRDTNRGEDALSRLRAEVPTAATELVSLDLASLASIRKTAADVATRTDRLDGLVCNAGVMALPRRTTEDGFEMQIGTNHLGHFALTGLLLPLLLKSPDPRVVVIASEAAKIGRIRFDDLMGERHYFRWTAYGQSKLANLLFARELGHRVPDLVVAAAHPGYAATNLQTAPGVSGRIMALGNRILAQSDEDGAMPQLYALTMPDVATGDYYGPSKLFGMRGAPHKVSPPRPAKDDHTAARLWTVSEDLTGVQYP